MKVKKQLVFIEFYSINSNLISKYGSTNTKISMTKTIATTIDFSTTILFGSNSNNNYGNNHKSSNHNGNDNGKNDKMFLQPLKNGFDYLRKPFLIK